MPLPKGDKIVGQKEIDGRVYYVVKKKEGSTYLEPKKRKLNLIRKNAARPMKIK